MIVNLLTKPDGSVCKDSSDNVKFLLQSHFTNEKILNEYPPGESEDTIWNEGTYEGLTCLDSGKLPGPLIHIKHWE
jgi:hypothetical protein